MEKVYGGNIMDDNEIKIKREKKPPATIESRLEEIEKWKKSIGEDIDKLLQSSYELKKELAQFVFQTVSVTMGLFAILLAVLIGFSANWDFETTGINYVVGLLIFLTILVSVWLIGWFYHIFKRK